MKRGIAAILAALLVLGCLYGCGRQEESAEGLGNGWEPERSMVLDYATQFAVDYYAGGYKLISLADGSRILLIPEGAEKPKGIDKSIRTLQQPVENIYLAASASMCLFDALERLDAIRLSATRADAWYIENARAAMERGDILFAGKYSEPDYEIILANHSPLAVESTMIGHTSGVKEKLEEQGIVVLVDQASYETHPLGRTEWIKLYGAILNEEEKAQALFDVQKEYLNEAMAEDTGKTAAFFYISSTGMVVARRSGDYVTKMIELAGGHYIFEDLIDPDSSHTTVTVEMETFFSKAKDADYIFYNSSIGGELSSLQDMLEKNALLAQMKAVQDGNVWCTGENMYQETTGFGQLTQSLHRIFTGEADTLDELPYFKRLR